MDVFTLAAKLTLETGQFSSDLKQAENEASGFGTKLQSGLKTAAKIAAGATATTAAAAGKFIKDSLVTGMEFDAMMSKVQSVSSATAYEFDELRQRAMDLGASTKFTAEEAAEILGEE